MTEPKPKYKAIKLKSKAVNRPTKSVKIGAEFHAMLMAMRNENQSPGMTMQRINEYALRDWAQRYYPQCLPILTGGDVDESKRPKPLGNAQGID